jgi:ATP-dependent helicase/nuclease subunit B
MAAALEHAAPRPAVGAFWGPRLANIGRFVLDEERVLRAPGTLAESRSEVPARLSLHLPGGAVELEARADRLDRLAAGGWRIIDYKTGTVPAKGALGDGAAPQLPLEAMLLEAGAFAGIPAGEPVVALQYWKLSGGDQPGKVEDRPVADAEGTPFATLARARLEALVESFLLGSRPFASRPHPGRDTPGGDYDHLARVAEWAAAERDE